MEKFNPQPTKANSEQNLQENLQNIWQVVSQKSQQLALPVITSLAITSCMPQKAIDTPADVQPPQPTATQPNNDQPPAEPKNYQRPSLGTSGSTNDQIKLNLKKPEPNSNTNSDNNSDKKTPDPEASKVVFKEMQVEKLQARYEISKHTLWVRVPGQNGLPANYHYSNNSFGEEKARKLIGMLEKDPSLLRDRYVFSQNIQGQNTYGISALDQQSIDSQIEVYGQASFLFILKPQPTSPSAIQIKTEKKPKPYQKLDIKQITGESTEMTMVLERYPAVIIVRSTDPTKSDTVLAPFSPNADDINEILKTFDIKDGKVFSTDSTGRIDNLKQLNGNDQVQLNKAFANRPDGNYFFTDKSNLTHMVKIVDPK